jgi:putative Ca2+/H+ antiporter (TMEM165/GDT1 family)
MLTPLKSEIAGVGDLSHEARRFRTILWTFERNMDLLFNGSGLKAIVDHAALAEAFSRWRQAFDSAKYLADVDRHDFVIFAAGLMLKELIAAHPLKATEDAAGALSVLPAEIDHRLRRWPEGYAYTSFCLSVAAAILAEMGDPEPRSSARTEDPLFWESFKENAAESPAMAVAFFDLVCGSDPNWNAPDVPWLRRVVERKNHIVKQQRNPALT